MQSRPGERKRRGHQLDTAEHNGPASDPHAPTHTPSADAHPPTAPTPPTSHRLIKQTFTHKHVHLRASCRTIRNPHGWGAMWRLPTSHLRRFRGWPYTGTVSQPSRRESPRPPNLSKVGFSPDDATGAERCGRDRRRRGRTRKFAELNRGYPRVMRKKVSKQKVAIAAATIAIAAGFGVGGAADAQARPAPLPTDPWCPGWYWNPAWGPNWDWDHCHDSYRGGGHGGGHGGGYGGGGHGGGGH